MNTDLPEINHFYSFNNIQLRSTFDYRVIQINEESKQLTIRPVMVMNNSSKGFSDRSATSEQVELGFTLQFIYRLTSGADASKITADGGNKSKRETILTVVTGARTLGFSKSTTAAICCRLFSLSLVNGCCLTATNPVRFCGLLPRHTALSTYADGTV